MSQISHKRHLKKLGTIKHGFFEANINLFIILHLVFKTEQILNIFLTHVWHFSFISKFFFHQGFALMKLSECYNTLNISPDSGWVEVKRSYHFLAKKYHPDVHEGKPGFVSKFRKITKAFKILEVSYKTHNGKNINWKQANIRTAQTGKSAASNPNKPLDAVPLKNSPTQLHNHKRHESGKKNGSGNRLKHFRNTLFEWERKIFLLDIEKNIRIKKRLANQGNIVRVKKGEDNFQVKIPPGPWTRMFIRIPSKGNKSLFSKNRGDLLLNIHVPNDEALSPSNPTFFYKVRIPRESLGTKKVWTLKSTNGPIRFTLPQRTEDGQKFNLKFNSLKGEKTGANHIITVHLV